MEDIVCKRYLMLFFLLFSSIHYKRVSAFQNSYSFKETIQRNLNYAMVERNFTGIKSLPICSTKCSRLSSKSLYYIEGLQTCFCNRDLDLNTGIDVNEEEVTYAVIVEAAENGQPILKDCLALCELDFRTNSVYTIRPDVYGNTTQAWCDMEGGGWTVIQRRVDGSEDFYRGWTEYAAGFGNRSGEYWIGLDNIYHLTQDSTTVAFTFKAFEGISPAYAYARYSHFTIGNETTKYKLSVSGYQGNSGDAMKHHRLKFSTKDADNDIKSSASCAVSCRGAWWYNKCYSANLNGMYYRPPNVYNISGVNWTNRWGFHSLEEVTIKIRRN